jgi:hypothetical protein
MFFLLSIYGSTLIGFLLCVAVVGLALAAVHASRLMAVEGVAGYLPARIKVRRISKKREKGSQSESGWR